jgi:hypothetical protein
MIDRISIGMIAFASVAAAAANVNGSLLGTEYFNYPADNASGDIRGKAGGTGWENAWSAAVDNPFFAHVRTSGGYSLNSNLTVPGHPSDGSSTYLNLASPGNNAFNQAARNPDTSPTGTFGAAGYTEGKTGPGGSADVIGATGKDLWISFIYRRAPDLGSEPLRLYLQNGALQQTTSLVTFANTTNSTTKAAVINISFGAGNADTLRYWELSDATNFDPAVTLPTGTLGVADRSFDIFALVQFDVQNGGAQESMIDAIRFGTTASDVTSVVPEPATLGLAALGAMLVGRRRR